MLRALHPSAAPLALRRLVAALLVVLLGGATAEPLLADVCDGDAPRAALSTVLPHVDAGAVAGRTGRGDVINTPVVEAGASIAKGADALSPSPAAPAGDDGAPQHAVHVCHCTHAHGGTLAKPPAIRTGALTRARPSVADARSDRVPPGPTRKPQLRPPALPDAA